MLDNLSYDVLIFIPSSQGEAASKDSNFQPSFHTVMLPLHQCRKCTYCSKYIELFWLFRIIYCNIPLTNINQTSPSVGTPCASSQQATFSYNSTKLLVVGRPHTYFRTRGLVMTLYHQWLTLFLHRKVPPHPPSIYSLTAKFARVSSHSRARTCDFLINSQTLYQLSYVGIKQDLQESNLWSSIYKTLSQLS